MALTQAQILQNKIIIVQQNLAAATATNASQNANFALTQDTANNQIADLQAQLAALPQE